MLPAQAIDLLRAAFPGRPITDVTATSGGFSNISVIATIGAERCAIKAATLGLKRADLRREARALTLLASSGLPIPILVALLEDQAWTVLVSRFAAGEHGLAMLAGAPQQLSSLYHELGQLLSALHRSPIATIDPALLLAERARQLLDMLPALPIEAELRTPLAASLKHPIWRSRRMSLVHGDAGLHNVLCDGHITALLDWEWAGYGPPLLDLAWLYWTMRWRKLAPADWESFLAGYGRGPALASASSPEVLRALALGQIAGILARVQEQPDAWQEWLLRLRWTLGLAFPVVYK
jgi:aminoglycoside phosphotransferase (APT) family kinase protein